MRPKTIGTAPCQEVVLRGGDIDLGLPADPVLLAGEPAPLITWPLVVTQGLSSGKAGGDRRDVFNLGIYRMQVIGRDCTYMRWLKHRGGAQHHALEEGAGRPAAGGRGDRRRSRHHHRRCDAGSGHAVGYQFAGSLRGGKVELVDCKTVPLKVPAEAEIVLEGLVSLDEYGDEGPYGDHTGCYNAVEPFPVFQVTAITMRRRPIYLSTFTGRPPDEPSVLGEALNDVFVPLLTQQFPEIVDFWLPPEGCSTAAVVSMRKAYPGHAKRVMLAVWSYLRQFMYTKFVIVVDHDISARDWKDVIWALSTNVEPRATSP